MKRIKKQLNSDFIKKWMNRGINPILLSILNRRNVSDEIELLNILNPSFENIMSPFLFTNIINAFIRLKKAIETKEKIIIFGDRDVDGTTSVAIIVDFLKKYNADVSWEVPLSDDHYGLTHDKVNDWKDKYNLCITVDCGITNIEEVRELKEYGIETIVIDHHAPLENVPNAVSIVNPKCENDLLFKDIAACGVTFLFCYGFLFFQNKYFEKTVGVFYKDRNDFKVDSYKNFIFLESFHLKNNDDFNKVKYDYYFCYSENEEFSKIVLNLNKDIILLNYKSDKSFFNLLDNYSKKAEIGLNSYIQNQIMNIQYIKNEYLPLVMLGLVADIMPLIKTNRILTKLGLNIFKEKKLNNFNVLFNRLNFDIDTASVKDFAWNICPTLNASGRMGIANLTVEFFLNKEKPEEIIEKMITNNEKRKIKGEEAYNCFIKEISANKQMYNNELTFFYSDEIHRGITGITATKLSQESNCPTIVASIEGEYFTGSMRGKANYHFVEFLNKANDILEEFGGHQSAAGFRFKKNKLESFKNFLKLNSNLLSMEIKEEQIEIDAEIPFDYLNYDLFKILEIIEPFGESNETPVFFTSGLKIDDYFIIGKERNHLKIFFKIKDKQMPSLFWNKANWFNEIHKNSNSYDVIYQLEINKFNNQLIPQMQILDLTISEK
jgi:single-stranded-DNA-specific exonuclease